MKCFFKLAIILLRVAGFNHFGNFDQLQHPRTSNRDEAYWDDYQGYCNGDPDCGVRRREFERQALEKELEARGYLDTKRSKNQEYLSNTREVEIKFTHLSDESKVSGYAYKLQNSKVFTFTANADAYVNAILVSTTEFYHPQFILSKNSKGDVEELVNLDYNNKFLVSKEKEYIVEVGNDVRIKADPFQDIRNGGFVLLLSSTIKGISDNLSQETIKLNIWDFIGPSVFKHNEELSLYHDIKKDLNHGFLNYGITPYFNQQTNSISLYYHNGSSKFSTGIRRSSVVEVTCNSNLMSSKQYTGKELKPMRYLFKVESKFICEVVDGLN